MPFSRPSFIELRNTAVSTIVTSLGIRNLLPKSPLRALAYVLAKNAHQHYGYLDYIFRMSIPFTAEDEYLIGWANLKGINQKDAVTATGTVQFTGLPTTFIPAQTVVKRTDGVTYTTDTDGTIGSGSAIQLPITATVPGEASNAAVGISLALDSVIAGIAVPGVAYTDITGGADAETMPALRTRMLAQYAAPPQGGAISDYVEWALQVPGVTRAWASQSIMGIGAVTVYTAWDIVHASTGGTPQGSGGVATNEPRGGQKATGELLLVADHIEPLRPVTALVYSIPPQAFYIDVTLANVTGVTNTLRSTIIASFQEVFVEIGSPLGMTIYTSDLTRALDNVTALRRYSIVSPTTDTVIPVGYLPLFRTLTFQ